MNTQDIKLHLPVQKQGGDYTFTGTIQSVFTKRSGVVRVVVENEDGILHIMSPHQLEPLESSAPVQERREGIPHSLGPDTAKKLLAFLLHSARTRVEDFYGSHDSWLPDASCKDLRETIEELNRAMQLVEGSVITQ